MLMHKHTAYVSALKASNSCRGNKKCVRSATQAERAKGAEVELASVRELQAQTGKPCCLQLLAVSKISLCLH